MNTEQTSENISCNILTDEILENSFSVVLLISSLYLSIFPQNQSPGIILKKSFLKLLKIATKVLRKESSFLVQNFQVAIVILWNKIVLKEVICVCVQPKKLCSCLSFFSLFYLVAAFGQAARNSEISQLEVDSRNIQGSKQRNRVEK